MYVFEFLKRMFRKSNTTVVIYLIINYILISAIIGLLFSGGGGIRSGIGCVYHFLGIGIISSWGVVAAVAVSMPSD